MENREETLRRLSAAQKRLPEYKNAYLSLGRRDFKHIYPLVRGYILDRYLLTEEICASDKLEELADKSLRYMLEQKRMGIDLGQISRSCSGASSVISKKVMTLKAVQDLFSVSMTPMEFANISTVTELAEFICRHQKGCGKNSTGNHPAYTSSEGFDPMMVRRDFPALAQTLHDHPLVYLDNAATMQMPRQVMEAVERVEFFRGNVHRGIHTLSTRCTDAYEQARAICAGFLGTQPGKITFTSGTTDSINLAAAAFREKTGGILVTELEHHSNFVPWQQMCRKTGKPFRTCPIQPDGTLDLDVLSSMLTPEIGLLAISECSNVLGMPMPLGEIIRLAHSRGIPVLVDGAQGICHEDVNVTEMGCDYYAFSGHKLGAPFGIGVLYCKDSLPPMRYGGGMVDQVGLEETTFLPTLEAGTPNVSGAVGLSEALKYRMRLPEGWQEYEGSLLAYAQSRLSSLPGIRFLGSGKHMGCLSFTMDQASAFQAAAALDQSGIALRSGNHCAQPLHRKLGISASLRVSVAFYNTMDEIDALVEALSALLP